MKVKGVVINARREFVREHFGEGAWEKVLDALPAADRGALQGQILATSWFPFELGNELDKAIVSVLGAGNAKIFEDLGKKSAQQSLGGVHKTFVAHGAPQHFLRKAGIIYSLYYDTGRREYEETGACSGVLTTRDAETFSVPDCLTVVGWYKEALRMCGASDVEIVEEECRARGGSCCRYRVQWKM